MPRETVIHGVYMLTPTLLFVIAAAFTWGPNRTFVLSGLHRLAWYPVLLRTSLSACPHGGLPLTIYR